MPNLSGLLPFCQQFVPYRQLVASLREEIRARATGPLRRNMQDGTRSERGRFVDVRQAVRPYLVAALATEIANPVIVLVDRPERAHRWYRELQTWLPANVPLHHFPARRRLPFERAPYGRSLGEQRLSLLVTLATLDSQTFLAGPVIVASARSLLQKTVPPETVRHLTETYHVGQAVSLQTLLALWHDVGYQPANMVVEPGTFSRRGGILDIYPPGADQPARIELFDNQIDTIRRFDPVTQRSTANLERLTVPIAREALPKQGLRALEQLAAFLTETLSPPALDLWARDLERLGQAENFPELDLYIPYLYPSPAFLLDYLPENTLVVVDDWTSLRNAVTEMEEESMELGKEADVRGNLPPGFASDEGTWNDLLETLSNRTVCGLGKGTARTDADWREFFRAGPRYAGRIQDVLAACQAGAGHERRVVITRQAERLSELLHQEGTHVTPLKTMERMPPQGSLTLVQGSLPEGWVFGDNAASRDLILVTDAEIFGWSPAIPRRPVQIRRRTPPRESSLTDLKAGDYVVHLEHGVGIFGGLVPQTFNNVDREYLLIEYAAGDKLYVPVYQADRVSRFVGPGDRPRAIHRLGTMDWERAKRRARKAVAGIARELLDIYARREVAVGHAFSPDTTWQTEIEAAFPYEETADQWRAIEAVKEDMERPRPMDRLVCGDAGYGKTEVALRAAFKAVMDGKQVGLLVPTTVLAQQHYNTFAQRLAPFPVEVEMLSRFRKPAEQRKIIARLLAGQVDIIIGTHRLLSRDVQFRDLGLLIIDEEQRFGVTHKEKLKKMRAEIDVLALTATPIPRTLYMAIAGIRDMSTIDTPPEDRLPIVTETTQYDPELIRRAVRKEMARGGQTFFVHNRVMSIQAVAKNLRELVPEARIAVAHGQMKEAQLEKVMLDFAAGKYDLLVCTNIIESGLDLPNANTIVIHRADWFGLAQLYQLRGRVGRGPNRAYAYLIHPPLRSLGEPARQRMEAIREATELGSGFRLAMRDLEIRGAGDMLGPQQHGHIAAVGFGLYTRLLAQAVTEQKAKRAGKEPPKQKLLPAPKVDLPLAAYLPAEYVSDSSLRLRLYQQLGEIADLERVKTLTGEWVDRFGALPEPAQNLLYVLELRCRAAKAPVSSIGTEKGHVVITLSNPQSLPIITDPSLRERVQVGRRELQILVDTDGHWRDTLRYLMQVLAG